MIALERHLVEITRTVWRCTLGFDVLHLALLDSSDRGPQARATVSLRGAWTGQLSVFCSDTLARRAAGVLFGRPPESITAAESLDALGELANMTGGNLKALLPGPCELSTPRTESDAASAAKRGSLRLEFSCGSQIFSVELSPEDRS